MENWAGEQDCDLTFIYFPGEYNLVLDICCYCSWQVKILGKKEILKRLYLFLEQKSSEEPVSLLLAGLRWGRRGTLAEGSSWSQWKGTAGSSFHLLSIPAENRGPERQEEGGRKRGVNPLSSLTPALYLLESNSLTSAMLTNKPANAASSSAPEFQLIIQTKGVYALAKPHFHLKMDEQTVGSQVKIIKVIFIFLIETFL